MDDLVVDIRDAVQFFVDDAMIAASKGLERRVHQLTKHSDEPVLRQTEPYEGTSLGPGSVIWDENQSLWQMWYGSFHFDRPAMAGCRSCGHIAVSADGVHWEKRPVGAFAFNGNPSTNIIVWEDGSPAPGGWVVEQPEEPDPSRRFKMIYRAFHRYLAYSPDGVTWRLAQKDSIWPNGSGDGLEETSFYLRDDRLGRWRGYVRVWRRHHTIRTIALGGSEDLVHWTGPKIIWEAEPEFGTGTQIYGMAVLLDGGLYWGLPWVLYEDDALDRQLRQTMHFKLGWSRDGVHWQALCPEQDAVPMGGPGALDEYMVSTSCPLVSCGDRWRLYYCGINQKHDTPAPQRAIGLAEIRNGGFVSLRAGDEEGVLLTKRFLMRGEDIRINARTEPGGSVTAELLSDGVGPMKELSEDRCDVFTGDSVDHVLSWRGRSDLSALLGQNVMLRLYLHRVDLYSLRVAGKKERFSAPLGPTPVRCGRCHKPPVIDGVLDDYCWEDFSHTGVAEDFARLTENVPAPVGTRASFTRDDVNLYIAVDCEEPDTSRLALDASGQTVNYQAEEVIEFRFNAPGQGTFFNQLMVTPSGKRRHCWFSVEEGGGKELDRLDWQAKTSVVPGHWYAELAVPFKALGTDTPKPDEQWRMNVLRFRHTEGGDVWEEASCWSCVFQVHRNDRCGRMIFAD